MFDIGEEDSSLADGDKDIPSSSVFDDAIVVGVLESSANDDGGLVSSGIGVGTGSGVASLMQMMLDEQMYPLGHGWSWLHGMTEDSSSSAASSSSDEVEIVSLLETANEDSNV